MYSVFKATLTVIIVFWVRYGSGEPQCTNGFMNRDTLRELGQVTGGTLRNRDQQQRIIPSIAFRCSGSITKWIVAARWEDGGGRVYFPELQIWRATVVTNVYRKISASTFSATAENANSIYEYTPSSPLPFQEGDILGIFQPSGTASRLRVYYVDNVGPPNYYYNSNRNTPPTGLLGVFLITGSTSAQNDQPLVAVEINTTSGGLNCTSGFATREAVEAAAAQSLVNRDRQQRIIPHINFTCDGAITKWIVDGRWDDSGMHDWYPDLQIWRRNGTNTFTKVGNTTLRIETGSRDVTYYEYSPPTPLSFQAGDVLGIFQPDMEMNRLRLYFQSGAGPQNYYETLDSNNIVEPPSDMFTLGTVFQNDLPLISVETTASLMTIEPSSLLVVPPSIPLAPVTTTLIPVSTTGTFIQLTSVEPTNLPDTSSPVTPQLSATAAHARPTISTPHSTGSSLLPTLSPTPSSLPPTMPSSQPATGPPFTTGTHIQSIISPSHSTQTINLQSRFENPQPTSLHSTQPAPTLSSTPSSLPPTMPSSPSSQPATGPPSTTGTHIQSSISPFLSTQTINLRSRFENLQPTSLHSTEAVPTLSPTPSSLPPTMPSSPSSQPATGPPSTTGTHIQSIISPSHSTQTINLQSRFENPQPTLLHSTQPAPTSSKGNTIPCYPSCSSSPPNTPVTGSEGFVIVVKVLSVLLAAIVGVIGITLVTVFVCRRRKSKKAVLHHLSLSNPVCGGGNFVTMEKHTSDALDSQLTAEGVCGVLTWIPSEYEEPVRSAPQYEMIVRSGDEYSEIELGEYVPTEDQRKACGDKNVYDALKPNVTANYEMDQKNFFTESEIYWAPASNPRDLYDQLSRFKFREIRRQQIQVVEHIGSGQFGSVSKGVWQSPEGAVDVAVKVLHPGSQEEDRVKFLQEAAIMGQFKNPNVIMLHGVVTVGEPIMIVLELMRLGDMKQFLVQKRPIPGELVPSSMPQMCLDFCRQIASGMEYLARKAFVHRDLAARNILVAKNQVCKIADFGMARDLEEHDYYVSKGGKIPVKWTALEALHFKKYSTASDVWSYGAVMYEIWSLGHKPFEGYRNMEVIRMVGDGYRLPPPPGCPRAVYELMILCWHPQASSRPTFSQLLQALRQPEIELLSWSEEDMRVHPQVVVLGAPLEAGKDLYPELQGTHKQTTGHT